MTPIRFSHSEIAGSKVVCTSPTLIAAYHVLHRLLEPRHPPYALNNLTKILILIGDGYDKNLQECYYKLNLYTTC
jgi:hypothetical protein